MNKFIKKCIFFFVLYLFIFTLINCSKKEKKINFFKKRYGNRE